MEHILLIRNATFFGGAEIYTLCLAKELQSRNIPITLWSNNQDLVHRAKERAIPCLKKYLSPLITSKINFFWFLLLYPFLWVYYFFSLFIVTSRKRVTVLHLGSLNDFLLFTFIGALLKMKIIWTVDVAFYPKKNWLLRYWFVLASHGTRYIITCSDFMKRNLAQNGVNDKKVTLVYNGVHVNGKEASRERFITKTLRIGFIGKVSYEKGIFVFLKAAKEALARTNNVEFWVVGNIYSDTNALLRDYQTANHIVFKGWIHDLNPIYRDLDIVVVPSLVEESFGFVAVEAMSHGDAVIVSDRGALPELVEHETSGIIVPAGDAHALAERILDLKNNKNRIEMLGKNAHERVAKMFSLERMVEETINLYRK